MLKRLDYFSFVNNSLRQWIPLLGLSLLLFGCASDEKKSDTPEGLFAIAEEFKRGSRYELALQRFNEVKNKFPYSSYATQARLAIADVYYLQESWPEAQMSYQTFQELHPTHPQIAYVIFRIGMSYYQQLPTTVDRDLTLSDDAIRAFNDVLQRFPQSEFAEQAKEKREETLKKLAGKEEYIANFYFHRRQFDSALPRYERLLQKYPRLGFDEIALARAAISASHAGQKNKAQKYLQELQKKYPQSSELSAVRSVVKP